jgi:hypothetical protein
MKNIASVMEALNTYVVQFLESYKNDKKAIKHALKAWNKDNTQGEVAALIQENMPKAAKKVRATKGPKDKNAPKGARSAYILFCGDERASVVADNKEMKAKDVLRELGARWSALKASGERKDKKRVKRFEKEAVADKERAARELEEYKDSDEYEAHQQVIAAWKANGGATKKKKGGKRKPKDKNAPKGARSAYILFCGDERSAVKQEHPDMKAKDVLRELGARWSALKESKKGRKRVKQFEKDAAQDKARYTAEMQDYTPSEEYLAAVAEWESNGGTPKRKTSTKKKKDPNAPKKARSAYIFFGKDMRQGIKDDHPDWDSKEVTRELSRMWKEDYEDESARKKWTKMAKADKKRFSREFKAYTPPEEDDDEKDEPVVDESESDNESVTSTKSAPKSPKKKRTKKVKVTLAAQAQAESDSEDSEDSEDDLDEESD